MNHFAIISVLLQHTHRNLSANQIKTLGQLKHRSFQKAKKQFVLPLPKLIAMSQKQPVRLIMDYVLIGRNTREITYPFNYTFNPNSWRMEPTIFVLFILAEVGNKLYPVFLDFWGQEEWETDDSLHLTKLDVARTAVLSLYEQGLEIGEVLFDAGFCSKAFVRELQTFKIPFVCRFPCSWKLYRNQKGSTAAQMFCNNRTFFYDRHLGCFLIARRGRFADQAVKLVAVANTRQKLDERRYYCLLTNQVKLNHTEILRHYKHRGKIEAFFKVLKSYLGMGAFHLHHPDEALIPHFQMRCAAFVILQDYATEVGLTLFQALTGFRMMSQPEIRLQLSVHWSHWEQHLVDPTKETFEYLQLRRTAG